MNQEKIIKKIAKRLSRISKKSLITTLEFKPWIDDLVVVKRIKIHPERFVIDCIDVKKYFEKHTVNFEI